MARRICYQRFKKESDYNRNGTVTCRGCFRLFRIIKGIPHQDKGCCTEQCYLLAGPPTSAEATTASETVKVPKRKKPKNNRRGGKDSFYMSAEWLDLRYRVLVKYGRVCMLCAETKGVMQVDHIKPRSRHPHLALDFENMQVLCKACNHGKFNRYEDDFRPQK